MYTPQDVRDLKKQVNDDLDIIVKRFNDDISSWEDRTGCKGIFQWRFDNQTGRKKLVKQDVTLPVFQEEVTEEKIQSVIDEVTKNSEFSVEKLV